MLLINLLRQVLSWKYLDPKSARLIKAEEDKIWAMISEAFSGTKEVKSAAAKDELKIKIRNMLNNYYKKI